MKRDVLIPLYALLSLGLLVAGCENKDKTAQPTGTATAAASATPEPQPLELSDDDVPVPEDYIEEATKEIDESNLSAKLDELEKDIQSE